MRPPFGGRRRANGSRGIDARDDDVLDANFREFEIATPPGLLRGVAGKASSGRVMIIGPKEVMLVAYGGDLQLDNDGELHTIPAGKAYRVVIEEPNNSEIMAPDDLGATTYTRLR